VTEYTPNDKMAFESAHKSFKRIVRKKSSRKNSSINSSIEHGDDHVSSTTSAV